ncbi:MAG: hypothetical protein KatS3mg038_2005 [Candidatus Kapaibacterium sp.]|nr:MAG: hypothetical protein KatS3mg038_2005 [Candidatus Kapabacteria bacterium]
MFACLEIRGDTLWAGSCELPAGHRDLCFLSGLDVWLLPDAAVRPVDGRCVVAAVSQAAAEPCATVSSWVLRTRMDRQFRRRGRWRAAVRRVRIERIYIHPDAIDQQVWVAGRYGAPVVRASAHAPIVAGTGWVSIGADSEWVVLTPAGAMHQKAGRQRWLDYRGNAATIRELMSRVTRHYV